MIEKILVLSTAHMQPSTDKMLTEARDEVLDENRDAGLPFRFCAHTYGYILFISLDPDEEDKYDFKDSTYQELQAIFQYARAQGCGFINFDRDAEEIEELPVFEW